MKEIIVLFSGGMDSVACLNWAISKFSDTHDIIPLYVNFGQVYAEKELMYAHKICNFNGVQLRVVNRTNLLAEDTSNAHIPLRNTFLILLSAALFPEAEGVVFGMLHGESCEDKNDAYVALMQHLLDSQFKASIYRSETRKFTIYTPLSNYTKTGTVKMMLNIGVMPLELNWSVGCYHHSFKNCGNCISCFNRWVARSNAGMLDEEYGVYHPFQYMMYQMNSSQKNKRLFSLKQIWLKRWWLLESYQAMNRYSKHVYGYNFVSYLLRN